MTHFSPQGYFQAQLAGRGYSSRVISDLPASDRYLVPDYELRREYPDCRLYTYPYSTLHILNSILLKKPLSLSQLPSVSDVYGFALHTKKIRLYKRIWLTLMMLCKTRIHIDHAVLLVDSWSYGYYHWLTDVLPRLEAYSAFNKLKTPVIIIPEEIYESHPRLVDDLLAPYGLDHHIIPKRTHCKSYILDYVTPAGLTGVPNPTLLKRVRRTLKRAYPPAPTSPTRIYVSRQNAHKRTLANEQEILDILEMYNFQIHYNENLTLQQQIHIYSSCQCLLGVHGAGLTNAIWMREGGKVIEIRQRLNCRDNCFFALSNAMHLDYFCLESTSITQPSTRDSHVSLDPLKLLLLLKQLFPSG